MNGTQVQAEPEDLKAKHEAYISSIKAKGEPTTVYQLPCCGNELEERAAPAGEKWDTLAICPHCGAVYMKMTTGSHIVGQLLESNK